jgi:hypothetical protein
MSADARVVSCSISGFYNANVIHEAVVVFRGHTQ